MDNVNVAYDDNVVYHFTSLKTAVKHILVDQQLRLSPYIKTNDPKESKAPVIPWKPSKDFKGSLEKSKIVRSMIEIYTKVICFSQDRLTSKGKIIKGYNLPTMWAHYADNHCGICLVFKKDELIKNISKTVPSQNLVCAKVRYSNDLNRYLRNFRKFTLEDFLYSTKEKVFNDYSGKIFKLIKSFFLQKRMDWSIECEYRFIINEFKEGYKYFNYGCSLAEIILGSHVNTNSTLYREIIEYAKTNNLKISRIHWEFGMGDCIGV